MRAAATPTLYAGFDDPALADFDWDAALAAGPTDTVFLTREYQRAWWSAFGRGRLLLIGADGFLAPLFADGGMVFLTGSGGSDYLDLIGDPAPDALAAALDAARTATPDFLGFRFYHLPEGSPTAGRLAVAARALGLTLVEEESLGAPVLDLADAEAARAALGKKSVKRHTAALRRDGPLELRHLSDGAAIEPLLEVLFEQHRARWAGTAHPSLFEDPAQRAFYRELVRRAADTGWLRWSEVVWDGRTVACHLGFARRGVWLWYKPAFDPALSKRSPGEVLLGSMLEAAVAEGARAFDFGLGEEPFKRRFATRVPQVTTWGLYP